MVQMVMVDHMVDIVWMFQLVLMVSDGSYGFHGSYGSDGPDRSNV